MTVTSRTSLAVVALYAISLSGFASTWGDKPYELKGVRLGMPLSDFHSANTQPDMLCSDQGHPIELDVNYIGQTKCQTKGQTTLAHQLVYMSFSFLSEDMVDWKDDRLYDISVVFSHKSYGSIRDALLTKFGKPQRVKKQLYQNAFGVTVEGELILWINSTGDMALAEYADALDSSALKLTHRTIAAEFERRKKKVEGASGPDM